MEELQCYPLSAGRGLDTIWRGSEASCEHRFDAGGWGTTLEIFWGNPLGTCGGAAAGGRLFEVEEVSLFDAQEQKETMVL